MESVSIPRDTLDHAVDVNIETSRSRPFRDSTRHGVAVSPVRGKHARSSYARPGVRSEHGDALRKLEIAPQRFDAASSCRAIHEMESNPAVHTAMTGV